MASTDGSEFSLVMDSADDPHTPQPQGINMSPLYNHAPVSYVIQVDQTPTLSLPSRSQHHSGRVLIHGAHHQTEPRDPQTNVVFSLISPILQYPEIARHRDAVCQYLQVPPDLWRALYTPRFSSAVQQQLRQYLSQLYGLLPDGLWERVVTLRNEFHFEDLQNYLVKVISSVQISQNRARSASGAPGHDRQSQGGSAGRPALHPSCAPTRSPSGEGRFASPQPDQGMQTRSTTPVSAVYLRSGTNPRSPYHAVKGRAPAGYKYFCPDASCTHPAFSNAGNYKNHMDRMHALYPPHNPADSLRRVSSRHQDIGDEGTSSVATNASDSPLFHRNSGQEFRSIGDIVSSVGQEGLDADGSHARTNTGWEGLEHGDTPLESALGDRSAEPLPARVNPTDRDPDSVGERNDLCPLGLFECSSTSDGTMSFGMFQASLKVPAVRTKQVMNREKSGND
ncbi:uncharacterized protein Z518_05833 [Rhinocladiella mackenziei CBS 650.93]|uniref:Uncharacterized protein n=1 Tax=Rhinocladiella mackenziei CBS 650.93 TaxID=1442369 RepID=A0A0D2IP86_9EURO|nr:uncharacterized protein Z518_05833 [Rhinocladiella mackenziei CBS 650.93]KIX04961.1 hypothetical protein Z518_05833 [Rhinocladiella mackenziei CBS 650.93]